MRNLRTTTVVYWVNISESSGAVSARLCQIMGHQMAVVRCCWNLGSFSLEF